MRVLAVSDIHIDYQENWEWVIGLSRHDFQDDVLILAGDLTDRPELLADCFYTLALKFKQVLFVPGNHELWVYRDNSSHSLDKFDSVCRLAYENGVSMQPFYIADLSIIPLLGWYDYSFAQPDAELFDAWTDFRACVWPNHWQPENITDHFLSLNEKMIEKITPKSAGQTRITFSHFLPRIDLMPYYIPVKFRYIYPALGTVKLEKQIRSLVSDIHVYGHSHVNRSHVLDGIKYINNAYGYPSEERIASKSLVCVYEN